MSAVVNITSKMKEIRVITRKGLTIVELLRTDGSAETFSVDMAPKALNLIFTFERSKK